MKSTTLIGDHTAISPQTIMSPSGEEMIVLSRRDYDALLAGLGDEDAEDRAGSALVSDAIDGLAKGEIVTCPFWVAAIVADDRPLRALRKRAGLTQQELAAAAGVSQGFIADIEAGAKKPGGDTLERLSKALKIEPSWLAAIIAD